MNNWTVIQRFIMRFLLPFRQLYLVRTKDINGNFVEMITTAKEAKEAVTNCNMIDLILEEVYPVYHA